MCLVATGTAPEPVPAIAAVEQTVQKVVRMIDGYVRGLIDLQPHSFPIGAIGRAASPITGMNQESGPAFPRRARDAQDAAWHHAASPLETAQSAAGLRGSD